MTAPTDAQRIREELKVLLVKKLRLREIVPQSIQDDDPLLKGPLGLDSIDLLELALAVEQAYGYRVVDEKQEVEALRSIRALAEFVQRSRTEDAGPPAT